VTPTTETAFLIRDGDGDVGPRRPTLGEVFSTSIRQEGERRVP